MYEERNRDIFDVYYRRWGDPARLEEALGKFSEVVPKLQEIIPETEHRIKRAITKCAQVFDIAESDFSFVVMVGLFISNGWATTFRGKPTSFLALECFAQPKYLDMLIAHETAHTCHDQCIPKRCTDFAIGEALFQEGLATVASEIVCPNAADAEYLWCGPNYDDWVTECARCWSELRQRFLMDLQRIDETRYTMYFGGKGQEAGLPKRAGYFIGYRAVAALHQRHTIAEMARWSPEHAVAEVKQVLEQMTDR
jgi:uncharacterized protein YjaZ